ncbi:M16 family metallopeptidase [Salinarimonas ramus]|uniref:Insulinase family protein n=1 Tax=Salinarimonas ramus TaxID=690164 RepID=A0A917QBQ8_9HYPH|nr:insulinase family protein [Salinarimonas ramus]GGK41650.1 hypothetical protein GCM10011322_30970 [Salinarimonas ramus]
MLCRRPDAHGTSRALMLAITLALGVVVSSTQAWSTQAWPQVPSPVCSAKGITLCVLPDETAPVVEIVLRIPAGAADDPADAAGAAHLLEHLLLLHAPDLAPVAEHGNAFVSAVATPYVATTSAREALDVVDALLAVFRTPAFTAEALARERTAILRERETRRASPQSRIAARIGATLLGGSPLGRDPIGTREDVEALRLEDAIAFHAAHYRADEAVLVVGGDVRPEVLQARVAEVLGTAEARPKPPLSLEPVPPAAERVAIVSADPAIGAPERILAALVRFPDDAAGSAAVGLLLDYLTSDLPGAPRPTLEAQEDALLRAVGFGASRLAPGWTAFEIRLAARPGVPADALDRLEAVVRARLAEIAREGLDREILVRLSQRAVSRARAAQARPVGTSVALAEWTAAGRDLASWETRPETAAAVAPAEIAAIARALATAHRLVAADLLPETTRQPETRREP